MPSVSQQCWLFIRRDVQSLKKNLTTTVTNIFLGHLLVPGLTSDDCREKGELKKSLMSVSMSVVYLYSSESYSISTALSVLSNGQRNPS